MQINTIEVLDAVLKTDDTISAAQRKKLLQGLRGEPSPAPVQNGDGHSPRIYSRAEAAKLLGGKTCRFIDLLARKGLLKKFVPPGNKRAIGVCGESLHQFIEGN
jgi:hypothetical protein